MSTKPETTPEQTPTPTPPPTPTEPETEQPKAPEIDWKAMSRTWESRAKANADAAKRLQEIEDAAKTDEQKLKDENATLKQQLEAFNLANQQAAWRADIAKSTGVPESALRGSTLEEIQAHADTLKTFIAAANAPKPIPGEGRVPGPAQASTTPGTGTLREAFANSTK